MTLAQIRDTFIFKYKIECKKKGVQELQLGDTLIAKLISDAETDIQRKHRVIENSGTITGATSTYTYDLPSDFGEIKTVTYNNSPLERVDLKTLQEVAGSTGTPTQYSLKLIDDIPQIQFDMSQTGVNPMVIYWVNLNSGYATITGSPKLPHIYTDAMVLYMISQFFDDVALKYELALRSLKESQYTNRNSLNSKWAGGI